MSNKATTWAYGLRVGKTSAKFVLAVLADKADESHSCYPGVKMIADETELSPRSVKDQLAFLESVGLITRQRRMSPAAHNAERPGLHRRTSDRYVLPVGMTQAQLDERLAALREATSEEQLPRDHAEAAEGADFAPSGPEPVDNSVCEASEGANGAPEGANERRALKEEPSERTIRSSSDVKQPPHLRRPDISDSDDDEDSGISPSKELVDRLRQVHPGLNAERLLAGLAAAGVPASEIDVTVAAREITAAAPRALGDPTRYVTVGIVREPERWRSRSAAGSVRGGRRASVEADVRSARARGLIDADWPERVPLPEPVAAELARLRLAEREFVAGLQERRGA